MELLRIDLTAVLGIALGGLALLIPIVGLTARLAVPPIIDAIARAWRTQESDRVLASLERRFARLERHVEELSRREAQASTEAEPELVSLGI